MGVLPCIAQGTTCGIDLLVTAPVAFIATALAYRDNFPTQGTGIAEGPNV